MVDAFPDRRRRTRVLGIWSAIVSSALAFGPTIGGVMVDAFGWRSIFLVNLPVGLAGMALTRRFVAPTAGRPTTLAVPGHVILIVLLASLSFALIEGPQRGWTAPVVIAATIVTAAAAALLPLRERRAGTTVMPWRMFREPHFAGANAVGFLFNGSFYGVLFLVGLYFQHARGASPLQAGLEILPLTVFIPLSNMAFSHISARLSNGPLLITFLLIAAAASFALTAISPTTPYWLIALALAVTGIAGGVVSPAMTATLVDAAGPDQGNVAGSVLNANRQVGTLVGIAGIGALLGATHDWTTGATASFLVVGVAYLLAAAAAWTLVTRRPHTPAPAPKSQGTAELTSESRV
ncbi:MFS transporter [Actinomadura yumaensis]|uniref:MFS transporter n=1 Tax=Actinomadura yumaensis TaxID=111807 RepID=UPI00360B14B9